MYKKTLDRFIIFYYTLISMEEKQEKETLKEWFNIKTEKGCKPCFLGPLAGYYKSILEEYGMEDKAEELEKIAESGDVDEIIDFMDNIKVAVCNLNDKACKDLWEADEAMKRSFNEMQEIEEATEQLENEEEN